MKTGIFRNKSKGRLISFLLIGIIAVSLVQTPACSQTTQLAKGVNYLSYGNAWGESNAILQSDFSRFADDGIRHVSIRIMWKVMMPNSTEISSTALENLKRVLDFAGLFNIKVDLAFWTQFNSKLGFPAWAGTDYYSLLENQTKNSYEVFKPPVELAIGFHCAYDSQKLILPSSSGSTHTAALCGISIWLCRRAV